MCRSEGGKSFIQQLVRRKNLSFNAVSVFHLKDGSFHFVQIFQIGQTFRKTGKKNVFVRRGAEEGKALLRGVLDCDSRNSVLRKTIL